MKAVYLLKAFALSVGIAVTTGSAFLPDARAADEGGRGVDWTETPNDEIDAVLTRYRYRFMREGAQYLMTAYCNIETGRIDRRFSLNNETQTAYCIEVSIPNEATFEKLRRAYGGTAIVIENALFSFSLSGPVVPAPGVGGHNR